MKSVKALLIAASIGTAISTTAVAEQPFEDHIEARQGYYQVIKFNMGILGAMVKGKQDYDAAVASTAAKNIYNMSMIETGMMWPPGSDMESVEGTKAKADIWSNFPDVQEKSETWVQASKTLSENAGNGLDALKKSFGPVGKSCKSCHNDYKAK